MTITEFLLARIAEDDEKARHVWPERYTDRMLAECESKRAIIGERNDRDTTLIVMRHLAAVYADHPDYRDEWRP